MAFCTVAIFSASSSGISMPNASSKAITSSTVSSESAPRSSTNEAVGVTSASSTPSCSTIICFTRSSTLAILVIPPISAIWNPRPLHMRGLGPQDNLPILCVGLCWVNLCALLCCVLCPAPEYSDQLGQVPRAACALKRLLLDPAIDPINRGSFDAQILENLPF